MKTNLFFMVLLCVSMAACGGDTDSETTDSTVETETTFDATTLEGRWRSEEDEKSVVIISGDSFVSVYDGAVVSEEAIEYFASCPDECAENLGDMSCFMLKGEIGSTCYTILDVTEEKLQYSMLGGRGNTLSYSKIE